MSFVNATGNVVNATTPRAVDLPTIRPQPQIGTLRCPDPLSAKQISILRHLVPSLTEDFLREEVVPIICQNSKVSLRALDWTVTNYSKKHCIVIRHNNDLVDVHESYKTAPAAGRASSSR